MKTLRVAIVLVMAGVSSHFGCGGDAESTGGSGSSAGNSGAAGASGANGAGGNGQTAGASGRAGGSASGASGIGGAPRDGAAGDGGDCRGKADCGGRVCCQTVRGNQPVSTCLAATEECMGLVLCRALDDCSNGTICCPQGFCGGCD
jgi:hypothetical protein